MYRISWSLLNQDDRYLSWLIYLHGNRELQLPWKCEASDRYGFQFSSVGITTTPTPTLSTFHWLASLYIHSSSIFIPHFLDNAAQGRQAPSSSASLS